PLVWNLAGRCGGDCRVVSPRTTGKRGADTGCSSDSANKSRLHAGRGAEVSDLLGHVCDVRHGPNRNADGARAALIPRPRLQDRRGARHYSLLDTAHPAICRAVGPGARWSVAAVRRLDIRPDWPREYDVYRLLGGRYRHIRAVLLRDGP